MTQRGSPSPPRCSPPGTGSVVDLGSQQALAQFANDLATQTGELALKRFDRLRRNRSRSEYGSRTFGGAEVKEAIDTANAIRVACAKLG
jgi:hypothetical protein